MNAVILLLFQMSETTDIKPTTGAVDSFVYFLKHGEQTKKVSGKRPGELKDVFDVFSEKFQIRKDATSEEFIFQLRDSKRGIDFDLEDFGDLKDGALILGFEKGSKSQTGVTGRKRPIQNDGAGIEPPSAKRVKPNENDGGEEKKEETVVKEAVPGVLHSEVPRGFHVKLKGLPYQTSNEELEKFLSNVQTIPSGIWLPVNSTGKLCVAFPTFFLHIATFRRKLFRGRSGNRAQRRRANKSSRSKQGIFGTSLSSRRENGGCGICHFFTRPKNF